MRFPRSRSFGAAFLAAGLTYTLTASAQTQNVAPPKIAPAQHFQFTPQPGTAWYLDGSSDGQAWNPQAGPFFANGAAMDHFQPAGPAKQFRLRYVDPATIGNAPVVLSNTSLAMEKAGELIEVVFINPVRGILRLDDNHAGSFTYTWIKTSADEGEAILSGEDGSLRLLRLKFKDRMLGRWGMEDIPFREAAARITRTLDAGAFAFHDGRFRRGQSAASLPGALEGLSMLFNEGGRMTHLSFPGGGTIAKITTPKGATLDAEYSYDPETAFSGELQLSMPNIGPVGFRLNLDTPGVGHFSDIPSVAGQSSSRFGTFTLPTEVLPPLNPDCPPPSIAGSSFLLRDSTPITLTFLADGTGYTSKEVDGTIRIVGFFYSYSPTGSGSAKVSLVFPGGTGDVIDDYDMTWSNDCTGEFTRESFSNGTTAGRTSGTFGPGQIGGLGGGPPPGLGL